MKNILTEFVGMNYQKMKIYLLNFIKNIYEKIDITWIGLYKHIEEIYDQLTEDLKNRKIEDMPVSVLNDNFRVVINDDDLDQIPDYMIKVDYFDELGKMYFKTQKEYIGAYRQECQKDEDQE